MPRKRRRETYKKTDNHAQNRLRLRRKEAEEKLMNINKKKIRLRTSLDVYNRLMHDFLTFDLDLNHIFIGYEDKFLSPDKEIEVCILDWVMIDKGGDIPLHRIQYFSYNIGGTLICRLWDRKTRIDRLFGSGHTKESEKLVVMLATAGVQRRMQQALLPSQHSQKKSDDDENEANGNQNNNMHNRNTNVSVSGVHAHAHARFRNSILKKKSSFVPWYRSMPFETYFFPFLIPISDPFLQHFPRYPITADGFVQSLDFFGGEHERRKIVSHLETYGLVVVRNVFSENDCQTTIDCMCEEIFQYTLEKKRLLHSQHQQPLHEMSAEKTSKIDIHDPQTWINSNFPRPKTKFLIDRPALCAQAFKNRCKKSLYDLFRLLYGANHTSMLSKEDTNANSAVTDTAPVEHLNVSVENWGIARGTKLDKHVKGDGNHDEQKSCTIANENMNQFIHEMKEWEAYLKPHWDINPWIYTEHLKSGHYQNIFQGALALTEQRMEDGTHLTLPGCSKFLAQFCSSRKSGSNPHRHSISMNDPLLKYMQAIPLRKGEFLIWNYGQLHATTPNQSSRMRIMQYLRMYPSEAKHIERDHYGCQQILHKHRKAITPQQLKQWLKSFAKEKHSSCLDYETCLKLLGLKEWNTNQQRF